MRLKPYDQASLDSKQGLGIGNAKLSGMQHIEWDGLDTGVKS